MHIFSKINIFITSFFPLFVTILFEDLISIFYMKNNNINAEIISIIIILMTFFISIFKIFRIKNIYNKKSSYSIEIKNVSIERSLNIEYLYIYIIPLFLFDFTLWFDCIKFLIYIITVLFLFIKNNNIFTNILLESFGYRIYKCKAKFIKETKEIYLISKEPMVFKNGHILDIVKLDVPFYFYQNITQ